VALAPDAGGAGATIEAAEPLATADLAEVAEPVERPQPVPA
jgi:hypothetical protein